MYYIYKYINVYITYLYILITCKDAVLKICVFSSLWFFSAKKSYKIFGSKGSLLILRWVVHILLWVVFEIFLPIFLHPIISFLIILDSGTYTCIPVSGFFGKQVSHIHIQGLKKRIFKWIYIYLTYFTLLHVYTCM